MFTTVLQLGNSEQGDQEIGTQLNFLDLAQIAYYLSTTSDNETTYAWTVEFSPFDTGILLNVGWGVDFTKKNESYQWSAYWDLGRFSILADASDTLVTDIVTVRQQDQKEQWGLELAVASVANRFLVGYSSEALFSGDTGIEIRLENRHDFAPNIYWEASYLYTQQDLTVVSGDNKPSYSAGCSFDILSF